jgi:DNA-directed RNA polymerase
VHLALTVNACVRANMADIMPVHDSYGCLAPRAEQLNSAVREQLVAMYEQHDPLTEIRERALQIFHAKDPTPSQMSEALAQHPLANKRVVATTGVQTPDFPKVPMRGDLDLRTFIKNVYGFSS